MSNLDQLQDDELKLISQAAHRIPFRSTFRGTTNIAAGFYPTIRIDKKRPRKDTPTECNDVSTAAERLNGAELVASFRGRKLMGKMVTPPNGFTSVVMLFPKHADTVPEAEFEDDAVPQSSSSSSFHRHSSADSGSGAAALSAPKVWAVIPSVVMWEHDRPPGVQDTESVTKWAQLAELVHQSAAE